MDGEEECMTKVAFCFPGQGSLEVGMGREIAEAVPEAMEVYRVGSEATGMDLAHLCFESPLEELVETEVQQPTLVATSLAILAAVRKEGIEPDIVVGHSVGEFAALASVRAMSDGEAIGLVRERGLAMAEAARQRPGAMAAILGLEDQLVETLCRKILGVWPANYNCPGQIVVSGENDAVEECWGGGARRGAGRGRRRAVWAENLAAGVGCAEPERLGARRAIRLKVSGAFHSPLVGQAGRALKPAIDRIRFSDPVAPFMSTVTAKIEPAQRLGSLLVDQLTAPVRFTQAAGELMRGGVTTFVEIGPGSVLSGLVKRIDRGVRTFSVNDLASLEKVKEALSAP
jgi:[acyl-carrier-protein] S-malonyltransferase